MFWTMTLKIQAQRHKVKTASDKIDMALQMHTLRSNSIRTTNMAWEDTQQNKSVHEKLCMLVPPKLFIIVYLLKK